MLSSKNTILGGGAGLIASDVSAYCPGPASLTAATRNSYGLPSTRPRTVTLLSGTNSPGAALF